MLLQKVTNLGYRLIDFPAGARIVYTQGEGKSKTELVLEWLGPVSRTFKYSCAKGFSVQMDVTEYTLEIHCVLVLSSSPLGISTPFFFVHRLKFPCDHNDGP